MYMKTTAPIDGIDYLETADIAQMYIIRVSIVVFDSYTVINLVDKFFLELLAI